MSDDTSLKRVARRPDNDEESNRPEDLQKGRGGIANKQDHALANEVADKCSGETESNAGDRITGDLLVALELKESEGMGTGVPLTVLSRTRDEAQPGAYAQAGPAQFISPQPTAVEQHAQANTHASGTLPRLATPNLMEAGLVEADPADEIQATSLMEAQPLDPVATLSKKKKEVKPDLAHVSVRNLKVKCQYIFA